ncbi:uncharacterized protein BDZ99DRAFT_457356 [Mytilinidion resinicola]|uniref:Uncharacterized protein n=1 Tax=Mytilinidion resinicola TaxID=574789 RepID=A0A6A6Z931_9PEZI|nr:uncharacterized protein BDZ99DRAFT_457356 [Mytilinidion resinicola]KAF2817631.1 hypothetical protein BDZ99DRAFT_457356 [Mytilinidion resinicola]
MDAFTTFEGPSAHVVKFEAVFDTEVSKHNMSYEKQVSAVMTKLRALHDELHQAIKQQSHADALNAADKMSFEIAELSRLATELDTHTHSFLSTQKENQKFQLQAVIQETMRTSFAEIESYQRKLSLQNDVILGQQKAFNEYRAESGAKMIEMAGASEKLSRSTLIRGLLKSELHECHADIRELQANAEKSNRTCESLSATITSLLASKQNLEKENASMRTELAKRAKEIDRVSDLYDGQLEKYKLQAGEFARVYQDWLNAKKDIKSFKSENEALKSENGTLKSENAAHGGVEGELRARLQQLELEQEEAFQEAESTHMAAEWTEKEAEWAKQKAGWIELINEVFAKNKVFRKETKHAISENAVLKARIELMQAEAEASHASTEETVEQSLMDMDDATWTDTYHSLTNGSASVNASSTP